ncbi:MAG: hypothetical protein ACOWWM_17885 [Desulfobacterales bacterium]
MNECKLYHLHGRYYLVCWDNDLNLRVTYKRRGDWLVNIEDETDAIKFEDVVACREKRRPGDERACWYKGPNGGNDVRGST